MDGVQTLRVFQMFRTAVLINELHFKFFFKRFAFFPGLSDSKKTSRWLLPFIVLQFTIFVTFETRGENMFKNRKNLTSIHYTVFYKARSS